MAKLTKEQKALIELRLAAPYGRVEFQIDGHAVLARVEPYKTRRWTVVVYVDGVWKGEYLKVGHDFQKRFYRLIKVSWYNPKQKAKLIKVFGKREANKRFFFEKASYCAVPNWDSVKSMLRHFEANNESVVFVDHQEVRDVAGT